MIWMETSHPSLEQVCAANALKELLFAEGAAVLLKPMCIVRSYRATLSVCLL